MADFLSAGFVFGKSGGGYGKSIGPVHADYSNFGKKYQIPVFGPKSAYLEKRDIFIFQRAIAAKTAAEGGIV